MEVRLEMKLKVVGEGVGGEVKLPVDECCRTCFRINKKAVERADTDQIILMVRDLTNLEVIPTFNPGMPM